MKKISLYRFVLIVSLIVYHLASPLARQGGLSTFTNSASAANIGVTATVPDVLPPTAPVLISPENGSYTNNPTPTFSFYKSTDAGSPIHYYQLYINNQLVVSQLPAAVEYKKVDQFTLWSDLEKIWFVLNQPFEDGKYDWQVKAFDLYGNQANSATWTFTIDTQPPFILVTQVAQHTNLGLSSQDPSSIAPGLEFVTQELKPTISGKTEPGTALKLILQGQKKRLELTTTSLSNGNYRFKPESSLAPGIYKLMIFATDPATNTTTLKPFWLKIVPPQPRVPSYVYPVWDYLSPSPASTPAEKMVTNKIIPAAATAVVTHFAWTYLATGLPLKLAPIVVLKWFLWPILAIFRKPDDRIMSQFKRLGIAFAWLKVYDLKGKLIKRFVCNRKGRFSLRLKEGFYLAQAGASLFTTHKMCLMVKDVKNSKVFFYLIPLPMPKKGWPRARFRAIKFLRKYQLVPLFLALGLTMTGVFLFPQRVYFLFFIGLVILLGWQLPFLVDRQKNDKS